MIFVMSCLIHSMPVSFAQNAHHAKIDELKILAKKLGWSQNVLVSRGDEIRAYDVLAIADSAFDRLESSSDKASVQWCVGHQWPLEKIFENHQAVFKKQGFNVTPIPGLGKGAFRAERRGYAAGENKAIHLKKSWDIIEILSREILVIFRDERTRFDADAGSIYEEMNNDPVLKKAFDLIAIPPQVRSVENTLPSLIEVTTILPGISDIGSEETWALEELELEDVENAGEILAVTFEYSQKNHKLRIVVRAFESSYDAESVFNIFKKVLKEEYQNKFIALGNDEFSVVENRYFLCRGVVLIEIQSDKHLIDATRNIIFFIKKKLNELYRQESIRT